MEIKIDQIEKYKRVSNLYMYEGYPEMHNFLRSLLPEEAKSYAEVPYFFIKTAFATYVVLMKKVQGFDKKEYVRGKRIPFNVDWEDWSMNNGWSSISVIHRSKVEMIKRYPLQGIQVWEDKKTKKLFFNKGEEVLDGQFIAYEVKKQLTVKEYDSIEMKILIREKHLDFIKKKVEPLFNVEIEQYTNYPLTVMPKGYKWFDIHKRLKKEGEVLLYQQEECHNCIGPSWSHYSWFRTTAAITITRKLDTLPHLL